MAKRRVRFYPADVYLRDRTALRAFTCERCGYKSCTGIPPLCQVCQQCVETVRCEPDEQADQERSWRGVDRNTKRVTHARWITRPQDLSLPSQRGKDSLFYQELLSSATAGSAVSGADAAPPRVHAVAG
jgi:hypothetical protein